MRETKIAIVADVRTLQCLPRIIGRGLTAELALTGKDFSGDYAREIAENSPLVTQRVKQVLRFGEYKSVDGALEYVAVWNSASLMSHAISTKP